MTNAQKAKENAETEKAGHDAESGTRKVKHIMFKQDILEQGKEAWSG
jgi:hypothetical protein